MFKSKDDDVEIYSPSQSSEEEAQEEEDNEDDVFVHSMLKEVVETPSESKQMKQKDLEVEFELAVSLFFPKV